MVNVSGQSIGYVTAITRSEYKKSWDMEKVLVLRTLENKKILSDVVLMLICKSHGKYLNILRKEYLYFCLHHRKATNK